jgi:Ca2+-binding RTX toxin-like protein
MWIRAGTGSHSLDGDGGNDALYGNDGNDRLDGGGGNNFVSGGGGDDVLIAGGGIDILLGGDGDDDIGAGNGSDVLMGGAGNDVMKGGGGDDVLIGSEGNDTLTGGGGANRFVYAESGAANVDTITDYRASSGDVIGLSALLDAAFGPTSNVADFGRLLQSGSDITVQVDVDGTVGGANWTDVAILSGYGTSGMDLVHVYFDNTNHDMFV